MSSEKNRSIWVIGIDYGTEGKEAPDIAFDTKEEAEQTKAIIEKVSPGRVYIAEVPVWARQ